MTDQHTSPPGSLFGAILLISGCCIGAGMLGLPVLSAVAGFAPSMTMLIVGWLFMLSTGLLVLEVNLWFLEDVSLISMAGRALGAPGKVISWVSYLFLFYAIMVAYISGSGALLSDFIFNITSLSINPSICSLILLLFFSCFLYLGTKSVDLFNRWMMAGLIISYLFLLILGFPHIQSKLLSHCDWSSAFLVLPTMILSFGYHNLIPSLKTYFCGDVKRLRLAIIIGSAIPMVIYLLWEILILGLIPLEGEGGFRQGLDQGELATQLLKGAVGGPWVVVFAQYFSFFAIVTSFLGVGLSFVDFLADGFHIKKTKRSKLLLCLAVLLPPYIFSIYYSNVFILSLNYAGAFGVVILFGILPAAMVWVGRYCKKLEGAPQLPGGKLTLLLVFAYSIAVILLQIATDTSLLENKSPPISVPSVPSVPTS